MGAWIETHLLSYRISPYQVAPYVGAWIETPLRVYSARLQRSHPTWVRGLKRIVPNNELSANLVAPYVGAWIETLIVLYAPAIGIVAPYVGAWIETSYKSVSTGHSLVAPYVGAWIETLNHHNLCFDSKSHPTWVRGLKQSFETYQTCRD